MSNAIVKVEQQPSAVDPFRPRDTREAMDLASALAKSDLVPDAYKGKPSNVLLAMIAGNELGLGVAQALRGMHVVKGRPILSAETMGALVLGRRDVCQFLTLTHSDDLAAEYTTQRVGSPQPVTMRYTKEQAVAARLWGQGNWAAHPAAMLRARCLSALCRAVYPDLLLGVREQDEQDEIERSPRPAQRIEVAPPIQPAPALPAPAEVVVPATGEVVEGEVIPEFEPESAPADLPVTKVMWQQRHRELLRIALGDTKRLTAAIADTLSVLGIERPAAIPTSRLDEVCALIESELKATAPEGGE